MAGFRGYRRSIIFDFEYSQVTKGTADVNRQMALLNAEFRRASEEVRQTGGSFDQLRLKQQQLMHQTQLQADKVSILERELQELTRAEGNNARAIERKNIELRNAQAALLRTQNQLNQVTREVDQNSTSLGRARMSFSDFSTQAQQSGVDLGSLKQGFIQLTMAVAACVTAVVKMSMTFDEEFAKVKAIMDTSQMGFDEAREGLLELSRTTGVAAKDLANSMYDLLSSGVQTKDVLEGVGQSAKLARVGLTDMEKSTDILTTIMNAYGLKMTDTDNIMNQLIVTQKLGKLKIDELAEGFGNIAGLAANAKVSLDQVGAALVVTTTRGLGCDESITALKGVLTAVISPTEEARKKAEELGLDFSLTALQTKGLAKFLRDVQRATQGNAEDMGALFGNVRALNGMLSLASKEGLDQFNNSLAEIQNSGGVADKTMEVMENRGRTLQIAWNDLKTTLIEVGDALAPVIDFIAVILRGLAALNPEIIIAVGTGMVVAKVLSIISAILPVLAATSTMASAGLTKLGIAGGISSGQILLIAGAVALVVGLLAMLSGSSQKAEQDMKNLGNTANGVVNNTLQKSQQMARTSIDGANRKAYAIGTQYHTGGKALVGEYGPEEVILPVGSKVRTASETALEMRKSGTSYTFTGPINVHPNDFDDFLNQIQMAARKGVLI